MAKIKVDRVYTLKDTFDEPTKVSKELGLDYTLGTALAEKDPMRALRMQRARNKRKEKDYLKRLDEHEERKAKMLANLKKPLK